MAPPSLPPELEAGGGIMGELIRKYNWSESSVGPIASWPQSLTTAVSIMLSSRFPMTIFWGSFPNLVMLYNDAYIPIVGARHPALGERIKLVWAEIWDLLCPMLQQVCLTGEPTFNTDQLLNLARNNYSEECYMTWSLSPIRLSDNSIGGVLNTLSETTKRVLAERRTKTLRDFGNKATGIENTDQACKIVGEICAASNADIPFSALYIMDSCGQKLTLKAVSGVSMGSYVAPLELPLEKTALWPVAEVIGGNQSVRLDNLEQRMGYLPGGQWPESTQSAVISPIVGADRRPLGVMVLGINPRRIFDDDYAGYFELVCGNVSALFNITKAREVERTEAEAINNAKNIFFSNISHEFRTPLTLILGPLEDALADVECPLHPKQRERLFMMQYNTLRLHRLVNSLLDFSRIEAGRMSVAFEPVDIVSCTMDLIGVFRSAFERAGLELIVAVPKDMKLELYVDIEMWEKIVYNLLSNAVKYTTRGTVTVSLAISDNIFEFQVKDTGIGIAEQELPRLFTRFYRVEKTAGSEYNREGTGIGLALTKELVLLHGGDITCQSVYGVGTAFTVKIPLGYAHLSPRTIRHNPQNSGISKLDQTYVQESIRSLPEESATFGHDDTATTTTSTSATLSSSSSGSDYLPKIGGRILLADDDADMCKYVGSLLRKYWTVVVACDGVQALTTLKQGNFDLVLSDIMMPSMNGLQLLAAIRADTALKSTPVILLSAKASDESSLTGLQAGADDYLVKPFSGKELIARVSTHLEASKLRSHLEHIVDDRNISLAQANEDLYQQIQETQNAEEALKISEDKYRTLARASPVGIIHTDVKGNATYLNSRWADITGYSVVDGLGTGWLDHVYIEDRPGVISAVRKSVDDNSVSFKLEFRYENKSYNPPQIRWVLGQDLPDITPTGEIQGFVCTLTDITERKQLERERYAALAQTELEQRKRATEAEEHKQQQSLFVDMICHEIRNPLNGILNNIDIMRMNVKQSKENIASFVSSPLSRSVGNSPRLDVDDYNEKLALDLECLDAIEKCALHQQVITNDVINASKLESHKVEVNNVNFSPYELVMGVANLFSTELASKQIAVNMDLDVAPNFMVNSDPDRISQVLMNLLTNSIKFTENSAQKSIDVGLSVLQTTQTHVKLEIAVEDTGPGLSDKEKKVLFQRFSQASARTSQQYGGSGLGLYISKMLVELLGGNISVSSTKGRGSKFSFTILCNHYVDIPPVLSPVILGASISVTNSRILIVEDNVVNQKVLARQLTMSGLTCEVANNGKEAIEKFSQGKSDLIFMDIEMPIMNGFEATKEIRILEKNSGVERGIPIIGLSGNARSVHHQMALAAGMNDYIVKPYIKDNLMEKIRFYLSKPPT